MAKRTGLKRRGTKILGESQKRLEKKPGKGNGATEGFLAKAAVGVGDRVNANEIATLQSQMAELQARIETAVPQQQTQTSGGVDGPPWMSHHKNEPTVHRVAGKNYSEATGAQITVRLNKWDSALLEYLKESWGVTAQQALRRLLREAEPSAREAWHS